MAKSATSVSSLTYWKNGKKHLSARDKVLAKIIKNYRGEMLKTRGDAFYTLARSIIGQQISVKAADSVWKKFEAAACSAAGGINPKIISKMDEITLRGCGLSGQKVGYMLDLSGYFIKNRRNIIKWPELGDEEIIENLCKIKGIGRWTAEMFLIFHMQRPDVFPAADFGLLKAIYRHYNAGEKLSKSAVADISENWRPYRTVATWYLWRSLDPIPVEY